MPTPITHLCFCFALLWGSLQRSPRHPSWISGAYFSGEGGKGEEEGSGREGKRGEGRYKGSLLLREGRGKGEQGKGEGGKGEGMEREGPLVLAYTPDMKS